MQLATFLPESLMLKAQSASSDEVTPIKPFLLLL
jgi:hypothetical protein